MSPRDKKVGLPNVGGILDLGKKSRWVCFIVLSELSDPKGEHVAFAFKNREDAFKKRKEVLQEGVTLISKDDLVHVYYPPGQIKKVTVQSESAKVDLGEKKGIVH